MHGGLLIAWSGLWLVLGFEISVICFVGCLLEAVCFRFCVSSVCLLLLFGYFGVFFGSVYYLAVFYLLGFVCRSWICSLYVLFVILWLLDSD